MTHGFLIEPCLLTTPHQTHDHGTNSWCPGIFTTNEKAADQ